MDARERNRDQRQQARDAVAPGNGLADEQSAVIEAPLDARSGVPQRLQRGDAITRRYSSRYLASDCSHEKLRDIASRTIAVHVAGWR